MGGILQKHNPLLVATDTSPEATLQKAELLGSEAFRKGTPEKRQELLSVFTKQLQLGGIRQARDFVKFVNRPLEGFDGEKK
jgi:hypothetical protein